MSISFSGAANSNISKTGVTAPASTAAFTKAMWMKRVGTMTAQKMLGTIRPTNASTGHDLLISDPSRLPVHRLNLDLNYSTTQLSLTAIMPAEWAYYAEVGSAANFSIKHHDGTVWDTKTGGQTSFAPNVMFLGSDPAGGNSATFLVAHVRIWAVALTDAELTAERLSATPVKTENLIDSMTGDGPNPGTALAGQVGTGWIAGAGGITVSADNPVLSNFTGVVISGDADLPSAVTVPPGTRFNRLLQSGNWAAAAWVKNGHEVIAGAAAAPAGYGTSQRILFKNTTGGVNQAVSQLDLVRSSGGLLVRRVDATYVFMRMVRSDFGAGLQGYFNPATGAWAQFASFGGHSGGAANFYDLGGGWWRPWLVANVTGTWTLEFYVTDTLTQLPALNKSLDVAAAQMEPGEWMLAYKPTADSQALRQLASISLGLSVATVGVGQAANANVQLLDNGGAVWDRFGPVAITSSDVTKATIGGFASVTDQSGRVAATVTGIAAGTSNIQATAGDLTSAVAPITVGTSIGYYVDARVEPGYEGTTGWEAGVYVKPAAERWPTTRLFPAQNQRMSDALVDGQSQCLIAVPAGVSVTLGQQVEVVLENDNLNGRAQDAPGMFPAFVVAAPGPAPAPAPPPATIPPGANEAQVLLSAPVTVALLSVGISAWTTPWDSAAAGMTTGAYGLNRYAASGEANEGTAFTLNGDSMYLLVGAAPPSLMSNTNETPISNNSTELTYLYAGTNGATYAKFHEWADHHLARGAELIFQIYMNVFGATVPANNGAEWVTIKNAIVAWLAENNAAGTPKVKYVCLANEPLFTGSPGNGLSVPTTPGWPSRSAAFYAKYARVVKQVIAASSTPTIKVIGPEVSSLDLATRQDAIYVLNTDASGPDVGYGTGAGTKMKDWIDLVSFHGQHFNGGYYNPPDGGYSLIKAFQAELSANGVTKPIIDSRFWWTSGTVLANGVNTNTASWATIVEQYARRFAAERACGVLSTILFDYGSPEAGSLFNNVTAQGTAARTWLAAWSTWWRTGTIGRIALLTDGRIRVHRSDGDTLVIPSDLTNGKLAPNP